MDRVVFYFSHGSCAGFVVNCNTVFCKPQDNRKITERKTQDNRNITARFPLNPRGLQKESAVVDFVTGYLIQFNG